MDQEQLSKLFAENPTYLEDISKLGTPDEIVVYLSQKGVTVTSGDLIRYASESVAELDDAALASVAGGAWTNNDLNDRSVVSGAITAFGLMIK
ncbi:hypothetical protein [Synechococcus sp. CBW1006]|uniref:hypothetical protein n=1 Tax=Synechococcus sp. CBW1006 TaxID=1353138 RepID=UPI0018CDEC87|nr:hypothetical protein [Synechococcus sp. CBW1006]QPN68042.1 hypothetical protein H8F26_08140 [Synechococcus sp. CBW1006]